MHAATCDIAELGPGTFFQRLISERSKDIEPEQVRRLVFCSGRVYFSLEEKRRKLGVTDVAIVTIEQLAPFPFDLVAAELQRFPHVDVGSFKLPGQVVWCQEEPRNMGAWPYVRPRLRAAVRELCGKDVFLRYVGRRQASSPATGLFRVHQREEELLLRAALVSS